MSSPKPLAMSAIKSAMPDYFARNAVNDAQALTEKNQRFAPLAATLAGYAVERAQSGNCNGMAPFSNFADSLKGVNGPKLRAMVSIVQGVKPAHLKSVDIADYVTFAEGIELSILALVAPKESKAKAPSVNWKALYETCKAESEALKAQNATLLARIVSLTGETISKGDTVKA